jgi:hypothetical protein
LNYVFPCFICDICKLIAAKRVKSLNYEYTGGGIVAEADVATYELLKTAAVY